MAAEFKIFPRVRSDIDALMATLRKYARSDWRARKHEILSTIYDITDTADHRPVEFVRKSTGVEFRRRQVRQYTIVYSYDPPDAIHPRGFVHIRAVRHSRVRNVFGWVRETPSGIYPASF